MVNRRGWLRIVEASIAILLIASAMLIFANRNSTVNRQDYLENSISPILEEIAKNSTLRGDILNYNLDLSKEIDPNKGILEEITNFVRTRLPGLNVGIEVKICKTTETCSLEIYPTEARSGVYTEERIITTAPLEDTFSPRKIKVFVWRN